MPATCCCWPLCWCCCSPPHGTHPFPAAQPLSSAINPRLLATALDSLRSLACLELFACEWATCHPLRTVLRRLCSEQLEHVGLSEGWLHRLVWPDEGYTLSLPPMPRVRSFRFTGEVCPRFRTAVASLFAFSSLIYATIAWDYHPTRHVLLNELPRVSTLRLNLDCLHMAHPHRPEAAAGPQRHDTPARLLQTVCTKVNRGHRRTELSAPCAEPSSDTATTRHHAHQAHHRHAPGHIHRCQHC